MDRPDWHQIVHGDIREGVAVLTPVGIGKVIYVRMKDVIVKLQYTDLIEVFELTEVKRIQCQNLTY